MDARASHRHRGDYRHIAISPYRHIAISLLRLCTLLSCIKLQAGLQVWPCVWIIRQRNASHGSRLVTSPPGSVRILRTPIAASLLERYSTSRGNTGHAQIVNLIVSFCSPEAIPSRDDLNSNILALLRAFPGLTCRLRDVKTRVPFLEEQDVGDIQDLVLAPDQILEDGSSDAADLIAQSSTRSKLQDVTEPGPLWRVTRYLPSSKSGTGYLALDSHHAIVDGAGSGTIVEFLLSPPSTLAKQLEPIIAANPALPPRLENVIDIRPGMAYMARVVASELIIPQMPNAIRRLISPVQAWPATEAYEGHFERKPAVRAWVLPAAIVSAAKQAAKEQGVKTLHPLLHMMMAYATWALIASDKPPGDDALRISSGTAVSLRKDVSALPLTSGNYIGSYMHATTLDPSLALWRVVNDYATALASPAGRASSRQRIGMLAYIPDPPSHTPRRADGRDCTGWERFLIDKATSANPVTDSFFTSNIGRLNNLPSTVNNVYLYQRQSPFGAAFELKAVGAPNGNVGLTLAWMESGPINAALAQDFERMLCAVFEAVAAGKVGAETTFAQVKELLQ